MVLETTSFSAPVRQTIVGMARVVLALGIRSGPTPLVLGSHKSRPSFFFFLRHDIEVESSVCSEQQLKAREGSRPLEYKGKN